MALFGLWPKAPPAPEPEPAPVEAPPRWTAAPVLINMGDQERIDHAYYRLDAMIRHMSDHGSEVSPQRIEEFHTEARNLIYSLRSFIRGVEREDVRQEMTARLDELVRQHVARGLEAQL